MIARVKAKARAIPASVAWGIGLIAVGLGLIVVSLFFHFSIFALVLTWALFFTTSIGGWLIGRGTKG